MPVFADRIRLMTPIGAEDAGSILTHAEYAQATRQPPPGNAALAEQEARERAANFIGTNARRVG
jgi:hypothetical protein